MSGRRRIDKNNRGFKRGNSNYDTNHHSEISESHRNIALQSQVYKSHHDKADECYLSLVPGLGTYHSTSSPTTKKQRVAQDAKTSSPLRTTYRQSQLDDGFGEEFNKKLKQQPHIFCSKSIDGKKCPGNSLNSTSMNPAFRTPPPRASRYARSMSSRTHAQSVAIDLDNVIVGDVNSCNGQDQNTKCIKERRFWILVLLIIMVAVVIAVGVSGTEEKEIQANDFNAHRLNAMIDFLANVSSRESLESSLTCQHKAVEWIAIQDPFQLDPSTDDEHLIIERYLVMLLYYSTIETFHYVYEDKHVCSWNNQNKTGVFCQGDDGRISHIILSQTFLQGSLPNEICRLKSLVFLDLSRNGLKQLPDFIGECSKLEVLNLGDNPWGLGVINNGFPSTLYQLTNLRELRFQRSFIKDTIPSSLGLLSQLRVIRLTSNTIFGTIPLELWNLQGLEELYLGRNNLEGSIPSKFSNSNLTNLYLGSNFLESTIPHELGRLTNLVRMDLSTNLFNGTFPELVSLSNLVELDLRDTNIAGSLIDLCNYSVASDKNYYVDEEFFECDCCTSTDNG